MPNTTQTPALTSEQWEKWELYKRTLPPEVSERLVAVSRESIARSNDLLPHPCQLTYAMVLALRAAADDAQRAGHTQVAADVRHAAAVIAGFLRPEKFAPQSVAG